MHENEFEKKIQEKMEELQFSPSDAVWEHVNKDINKEKKPRGPVFWLFFLFGLALLGGVYFFEVNKNPKTAIATVRQQKQTRNRQDERLLSKNKQRMNETKKENDDLKKSSGDITKSRVEEGNVKSSQAVENKDQKKTYVQSKQSTSNISKGKRIKASIASKSGKEKRSINGTMGNNKGKSSLTEKYAYAEKSSEAIIENNKQSINKTEIRPDQKNAIDSPVTKRTNAPPDDKPIKKDSAADTKTALNKKQQKKISTWKIGISGGAGISNINQSLFKSTYVNNTSAYTFNTAGSTGNNASPSPINSGASYMAGVFVNRHLSRRVLFSVGLNYHYYSTKIYTGSTVDSMRYVYTAPVPSSAVPSTPLPNPLPSYVSVVNTYYHSGNTNPYTNHYHLIELPLYMDFQLNKSQKLPLIWEAGLSFSYLMKSDALHFDPVTDVYYKNSSLFNKTQLNGASVIMFGVPIHKNMLRLGPQFQYGLTGILKKSTSNPEHIFYGGLKLDFVPGEK